MIVVIITGPQNSEWVESIVVYYQHDKLFIVTQKQTLTCWYRSSIIE